VRILQGSEMEVDNQMPWYIIKVEALGILKPVWVSSPIAAVYQYEQGEVENGRKDVRFGGKNN
jgi:hypothetical protein